MKIQGEHHRTLRFDAEQGLLNILDQTLLPFKVEWLQLKTLTSVCYAISSMQVRGAPAIGAVAAYGMVFAIKENLPLNESAALLKATRPTAVNLAWAVDRMLGYLAFPNKAPNEVLNKAPNNMPYQSSLYQSACIEAANIANEDIESCSMIGDYGLTIIEDIILKKQTQEQSVNKQTINILTHCNAGWLATVDWGTALAPIYKAHEKGINVHVWVDETRPRNQGALLTAFELKEQGVPYTLICDNAGGHLMQQGLVDLCLVGSDRTTANGDVCNKIGTYLKALAAHDNNVPFYVALPTSTIDWHITSGFDIPIEERHQDEVLLVTGINQHNAMDRVFITVAETQAVNPAFDVTPSRYVTGLITEKGIIKATSAGMSQLQKVLINDE